MAKVLLIEPNKILAQQYAGALKKAGHDITIKSDAQSAIVSADAERPDVIVLELLLANHGGVEFLYELRSYGEWQSIPVVILSRIDTKSVLDDKLAKGLNVAQVLYKSETSLGRLMGVVDSVLS